MKKIFVVVMVLCLLLMMLGCKSRKEALKNSGLFGEHSLIRMERFGTIQGSVSGSFFLGIGSVNGSIGPEFKIQFYWSPKPNEMVVSTLPYSKFRFIIDDTKDTPTIEFVFDDCWLNDEGLLEGYKEEDFLNLNDIILSDYLKLVRLRISRMSLEKEIYLPKFSG